MFIRSSLVLAFTGALGTLAMAGFVPTELLTTTTDGSGKDVQSLGKAKFGNGFDVNNQDGGETFRRSSGGNFINITQRWSEAALAGRHRLGIYDMLNPTAITWVLGNVNQDGQVVGSWTGSIRGAFGLALDNGIGQIYYTERDRNADSALISPNPKLNGFDRRIHSATFRNPTNSRSTIVTFEDLKNQIEAGRGGLLDFNDYAFQMDNVESVPEPATMALLGAAALAWSRKRKAKKA